MNFQELAELTASVIVSLGGGGGIVFALSGYLGRVWADRALEKHRQENTQVNIQLTAQLALMAEERKHSLQLRHMEHQVRFTRLYEKRARVIAALDRQLHELEIEGQHYVEQLGSGGEDAYLQWRTKFIQCRSFLESRQIYLTEELFSSVYQYLQVAKRPAIDVWTITDAGKASHETLRKNSEKLLAAVDDVGKNIPGMRYALIKEFRQMLDGSTGTT